MGGARRVGVKTGASRVSIGSGDQLLPPFDPVYAISNGPPSVPSAADGYAVVAVQPSSARKGSWATRRGAGGSKRAAPL